MGSAISAAARTSVRTTVQEVPGKSRISNINPNEATAKTALKTDTGVTARLRSDQPPQYHRKTPEEWSDTLKKISGAISSSAWEGEVKSHMQNQDDKERHPAQRSDVANQRLPGRGKSPEHSLRRNEHGMVIKSAGRLTQNQVLQMFKLRREDPQKWDALSIAKKYRLNEEDVSNLLSFSRTYLARMDSDGQVRGYYNSDPENTISRFEKD